MRVPRPIAERGSESANGLTVPERNCPDRMTRPRTCLVAPRKRLAWVGLGRREHGAETSWLSGL
jgi:hypothetical protein